MGVWVLFYSFDEYLICLFFLSFFLSFLVLCSFKLTFSQFSDAGCLFAGPGHCLKDKKYFCSDKYVALVSLL